MSLPVITQQTSHKMRASPRLIAIVDGRPRDVVECVDRGDWDGGWRTGLKTLTSYAEGGGRQSLCPPTPAWLEVGSRKQQP